MDVRRFAVLRGLLLLIAALLLVVPGVAAAENCGDSQHPSGKDRCEESGGSGTQGDAQSDPDDDTRGPERTNGGADEPDGPGGENLEDQDGNNGCGNDQDFEDDNEGLCDGNDDAGAAAAGAKDDKGNEGENDAKSKAKTKDREKAGRGGNDGAEAKVFEKNEFAVLSAGDSIRADSLGSAGAGEGGAEANAALAGAGAADDAEGRSGPLGRAADALAATGVGGMALGVAALLLLSLGIVAVRRARVTE